MSQSNFTVDVSLADNDKFRVQVGEEVRSGELYYLGIDPRNKDHEITAEEGLYRLIGNWVTSIVEVEDQTSFYLPFDFSDEFTRWLACEKDGSLLTVICGWAEVEGWSFSPSDFGQLLRGLTGFRPEDDASPQTFYTPRFLSDLRRSQATLLPAT